MVDQENRGNLAFPDRQSNDVAVGLFGTFCIKDSPGSQDSYFVDAICQVIAGMQVHLSKPGGQREGPLTVEQINRDLAARKYNDSDYWAWYEGLESCVPLHAVPGIKAPSAGGTTHFVPPPQEQPQVEPQHDEQPQEDQYAIATESWQAPAEAENGHDSGEQEDASQKSSRSEGETALIEPESDQTEQARFEPSSEMVEREESENQVDSETTLTEPAS